MGADGKMEKKNENTVQSKICAVHECYIASGSGLSLVSNRYGSAPEGMSFAPS